MHPDAEVLASQSVRQRFDFQVKHRFQLSEKQKINFPNDALITFSEKTKVFAVQGFGRFGLFGPSQSDSTVRFDRRQDWGAILWAPLVMYGLFMSIRLGVSQYRAGQPPIAFALVIWAGTAWAVVTVYLPMAWDRYLLPIQSGNALLAAIAVAAIWERIASPLRAILRRPEIWVFLILIGSYAFFWHSRDWNTASRLMLTYALVDRGTVAITGLDQQTNDKAKFEGQYYSDKLPGFSLLATMPYAIARSVLRLPSHPLNQPADPFRYWAADYWVTLGTSGLFTAATAVLLVLWGRELGCRPRAACLIGLAYGLATPAYVYATLAYGHQASAFALFTSFYLLWKKKRPRDSFRLFLAGFLAAYAAVIEIQVGPVSAILGFYLLAQCVRGDRRPDALALFAVGAMFPTLILLTYNQLAFGSPWDMGYFHHATKSIRRCPQRRQSPRLALSRSILAQAPCPPLGPLSRAYILRSDLVAHSSRLGRLDRPAVLGPGSRDILRRHRGRTRKPVLPGMDGRLVDRSATARSLDTVRDAPRGRPHGGKLTRGSAGRDHRPGARISRCRTDALVSIGRWTHPPDVFRPARSNGLADLDRPGSSTQRVWRAVHPKSCLSRGTGASRSAGPRLERRPVHTARTGAGNRDPRIMPIWVNACFGRSRGRPRVTLNLRVDQKQDGGRARQKRQYPEAQANGM